MDIRRVREEIRNGLQLDKMNLKVAYYARVSTDKSDQLNSLSNQVGYFEGYIKDNKSWKLYKGYVDEGISGSSRKKRKNFNQMIEDAKANKFDLILTKEISRFSRNTVDSILVTEELLNAGVVVNFITDNINTINEDSEFRLTIMASLAQDEVRKISTRVKFGIERKIKEGKIIASSLIGYKIKDGKLIINPKERKMIEYLYKNFVLGKSLNDISYDLYKMGYKTQKQVRYSTTTLKKIIRNPRYKGYYTAHLTYVSDFKNHIIKKNNRDNIIEYKDLNTCPPIINENTWHEANEKLLVSSRCLKKYSLSKKIVCSCGKSYIKVASGNRKNNPVWMCTSYKNKGKKSCNSSIINEKKLMADLKIILKKDLNIIDRFNKKFEMNIEIKDYGLLVDYIKIKGETLNITLK